MAEVPNIVEQACKAVCLQINNLSDCDFVDRCGTQAVKELRVYAADMVNDIHTVWVGRPFNDEEREQAVALLRELGVTHDDW